MPVLETKGLLRREVDHGDSRARRLHLTTQGADVAQRAIIAVEQVDTEMFVADAAVVTPLLQTLISRVSSR